MGGAAPRIFLCPSRAAGIDVLVVLFFPPFSRNKAKYHVWCLNVKASLGRVESPHMFSRTCSGFFALRRVKSFCGSPDGHALGEEERKEK